jgi:glycosyl transferase family 2
MTSEAALAGPSLATGHQPVRVCVFTDDLGTIARCQDTLRRELALFSDGRTFDNVCFVGLRATEEPPPAAVTYQPFVPVGEYGRVRLGYALLRLAGIGGVPASVARAGLAVCSSGVVEAIVACDPDVVVLDVRWASHLQPLLIDQFPGRVFTRGQIETRPPSHVLRPRVDATVKVSIVLPTFNGVKYLRQSIQSCLDQSHANLEVIIVDDGSSEDIAGMAGAFGDPRIVYVRHETNRGLPAALNTGFRVATGTFLTWTSDDNYYVPHAIERLTSFLLRHPRTDFVYSAMYIVEQGAGRAPWVRPALPPVDLPNQNGVGGCFLYRREVQEQIGEYAPKAILVEDYDYWIRVSKRFRMQRLHEPLYYYRYHEQSLTSRYTREDVAQRFDRVRQQNGIVAAP